MGKKSLENLDYEVNLCVESVEFAAQVLATIQTDLIPCKKIPASTCHQISLLTRVLSPIQILPM